MSVILYGSSKDTYTEGAQRSSLNVLCASKLQKEKIKPIQYFSFFVNSNSPASVIDKAKNKPSVTNNYFPMNLSQSCGSLVTSRRCPVALGQRRLRCAVECATAGTGPCADVRLRTGDRGACTSASTDSSVVLEI